MISSDDTYDPDALLREPFDDQTIESPECPVCGEPMILSHGSWVCPDCTGETTTILDEEEEWGGEELK
jgi:hypothetical protein